MNPSRLVLLLPFVFAAIFSSALLWGGALAQAPSPSSFEERYGISPVALRLTGAGHMLDFRFKVLDPAKAAAIVNKQVAPRLLDPASGTLHDTPSMPKVGAMRQTSSKLIAGKTYFIMFSNSIRGLKAGDRVTILFDDVKLENLPVQ